MQRVLLLRCRFFCYLALALWLCGCARGQDICRDVLKQTEVSDTSLWSQKLAYLWSISTQQEFEDAKSAHGGLKAIIEAIPVQAEADYNGFTKWRKQYSENLHWTASTESSRHLVTSFLPPDAINNWLECMKLGGAGLKVFATQITAETVTVEIRWDAGATPNYTAHLPKPQVDGGTLIGVLDLPRAITSDFVVKPTYKRQKNKDFILRMEYGNKAYSLLLPKEPQASYRQSCLISLRGQLAGADKRQDFLGVAGNYPGVGLWTVSCPGFAPGIAVSAQVYIDFDISAGGNRVSVAPYIVENGALVEPRGPDMSYTGNGPSGLVSSTVAGRSSSDGTVTIGIYVGIPAMGHDTWTLSARQGSYIRVTQP
jgi:hypothetical protein